MTEKPSPFCPKKCNFVDLPIQCRECFHQFDVVNKHPREIEMRWCGEWVKAKIVGRSQDKLYIESDKGNFTCSASDPNIKL